MEIEFVAAVPLMDTESGIEFHRNLGSRCADNDYAAIERATEGRGCSCEYVEFKYVREATQEDHDSLVDTTPPATTCKS